MPRLGPGIHDFHSNKDVDGRNKSGHDVGVGFRTPLPSSEGGFAMLEGFAALIVLQLAGEVIAGLTRLPIPGPVIGLGLLAGYALWRGGIPDRIEQAGEALLKHLSLLFVPAGVGLIAFGDRLLAEGPRLIVVLVVSTALTMIVTAFVFRALAKPEDE